MISSAYEEAYDVMHQGRMFSGAVNVTQCRRVSSSEINRRRAVTGKDRGCRGDGAGTDSGM